MCARVSDTMNTARAVQIILSGLSVSVGTVVVVNVKKIVGLLAIALLLFWVFTQPDTAAGSVQNVGTTLEQGAQSVITFVTQIL
jgi:hypothetical protein